MLTLQVFIFTGRFDIRLEFQGSQVSITKFYWTDVKISFAFD